MNFNEAYESFLQDDVTFDYTMGKINIFNEASYKELGINYREAELKVLKESGSEEDLAMLGEAASEGFVVKAKKAIEKACDALIEFIKSIKEKIVSIFKSEKSKDAIDKAEKAIKENPALGKKKVKVKDTEDEEKAIDKAINKINSKIAKIKSGTLTEKDMEEVDEAIEECNRKSSKKKIVAAAAVGTIVLSAAIVLFKKLVDKTSDEASNASDESEQVKKEAKKLSDSLSPEYIHNLEKLVSQKCSMHKRKLSVLTNRVKDLFDAIRGAHQSENLETKEESAVYNDNLFNEVFAEPEVTIEDITLEMALTNINEFLAIDEVEIPDYMMYEGANSDIRAALKKNQPAIKAKMKYIKKNVKNGKYAEAKKDIKDVRKLLKEYRKMVDIIKSDATEAVIGIILNSTIVTLKTIAATILTLPIAGLGGMVVELSNTVQQITQLIKRIKREKDITPDIFNMYKNKVLSSIDSFDTQLNRLDQTIDIYAKEQNKAVKESFEEDIDDYLMEMSSELFSDMI